MKKSLRDTNNDAKNVIIWGSSLITLLVLPTCNDPFNAPKSWILSITAFWLIGWIAFQIKNQLKESALKWSTIFAVTNLAALTFAFFFTDNKYIGFFGEYQRRTGYLSYIGLLTFFLASSYIFRLKNIGSFDSSWMIVGFLSATYAAFQHFHHDFINWVNPNNSVITTLGNPDFAAASMAIFLVTNFGIAIQSKRTKSIRILAALNSVYLFIAIQFSQVRQGQLTSILGVTIILIIWFFQRKKIISYALFLLLTIVSLFAVAGMLNRGPLAAYFYKISVTFRGDYWRAGWRMFTHHPLFGVGLDRYGANFTEYRDATQSMRRGPDLLANAAHNVPLQMAATGGIFVLVASLLLTGFIFFRGIISLRKYQSAEQLTVSVFFAAWLCFEAQSFISIDNLGVAIWGYVLGGIVVGLSFVDISKITNSKIISLNQPYVSVFLGIMLLIPSILAYKAEASEHNLQNLPKFENQKQFLEYRKEALKPISYIFKEPTFILTYVQVLGQGGDFINARIQLESVINSDKKNRKAITMIAQLDEFQKNWQNAIVRRKMLYKLDPYNQQNLLQLGEDEKNTGNLAAAKALIPLINSFAANTQEAKQALMDFGK
jgi:O-antigen ligase